MFLMVNFIWERRSALNKCNIKILLIKWDVECSKTKPWDGDFLNKTQEHILEKYTDLTKLGLEAIYITKGIMYNRILGTSS